MGRRAGMAALAVALAAGGLVSVSGSLRSTPGVERAEAPVGGDAAGSPGRSADDDGGDRDGGSRALTPPDVALGVINHGRRDLPLVALTFDSNLTMSMIRELDHHTVASFDNAAVIDELDSLNVPATFFLAGLWMERYPVEVRRLAADPRFELASHSYSHIGFAPHCFGLGLLPVGKMADDVRHSEQLLHAATPAPTSYFRFPGTCATAAAIAAIRPTGVTIIGDDVASGDAFGRSVRAIVANVLDHTRDGSIVVLHITGGNTAPLTALALPAIVTGLRARGFQLVRLSTLLAACPAGGCPQTNDGPPLLAVRHGPGRGVSRHAHIRT